MFSWITNTELVNSILFIAIVIYVGRSLVPAFYTRTLNNIYYENKWLLFFFLILSELVLGGAAIYIGWRMIKKYVIS